MDRFIPSLGLALTLVMSQTTTAETLPHRTEESIRAATFGFLAPSNDADRDSLVGTAFAIGPNEFVTAAHLIDAAIGSHFNHPKLVDSRHETYEIGNILQYSEQQDYAVFSLERPPTVKPLPLSRDSRNALSELYYSGWRTNGDVGIEKARFSSLTTDEESKEFDWLRFTGQVWNRAGGGPLLDSTGHVIGIVQARARDAGPNYAVPIDLLSTSGSSTARIHATSMLRALMPAVSTIEPLKAEIPLPLSFDEFSRQLKQLRLEYFDRAIGPLLEATRDDFALTGVGAAETCRLLNGDSCQCKRRAGVRGLLVLDNSRSEEQLLRLEKSQDVAGTISGITLFRTTEENGTRANRSDLSGDSLLHLSLSLKGQALAGQAANSQSVSKPIARKAPVQEVYSDFHGRTWFVRSWPLEHQDFVMTSFARRLATGYVVLTRTMPTALGAAAAMQLKFVANVIYYSCDELQGQGVAQVADRQSFRSGAEVFAMNAAGTPPSH